MTTLVRDLDRVSLLGEPGNSDWASPSGIPGRIPHFVASGEQTTTCSPLRPSAYITRGAGFAPTLSFEITASASDSGSGNSDCRRWTGHRGNQTHITRRIAHFQFCPGTCLTGT